MGDWYVEENVFPVLTGVEGMVKLVVKQSLRIPRAHGG